MEISNMQQLKDWCKDAPVFRQEVLDWVAKENLWNIWVPQEYGGLEYTLTQGLGVLKGLAAKDGSLAWTVTLCSGANFFIGNLQPLAADRIFGPGRPILGGSGGLFGTAEKEGPGYRLNGIWRYATGAPYLTHFTLNARILTDGVEETQADGSPLFRSFVIPASEVTVVEDWNSMGLKASATHSFEVQNVEVAEEYAFSYNEFRLPQPIFRVHFSVFADLTLWVNYVGMAEHLREEACGVVEESRLRPLDEAITHANQHIAHYAEMVEGMVADETPFTEEMIGGLHEVASRSVHQCSQAITGLHPYLGVRACREDHVLNQIFRDYFTATQHHIFIREFTP